MVTAMALEDDIERQRNINLQLRRQLEACRREVIEKCAKFCEDHEVFREMGLWHIEHADGDPNNHIGMTYAAGIRGMVGQ